MGMEYPLYLPGQKVTSLRVEGERRVAIPYDGTVPFPLPTLLCFAEIACRDGKSWAIFTFDRDGLPVFTKNETK